MYTARQSSGGVVVGQNGRIVLVRQDGNSWSVPKGGIDPGETPLAAAIREVHEECGITDLTLVCELGTYERFSIAQGGIGEDIAHGLRKRTLFLFRTRQTAFQVDGLEITEARWVTLDEALVLLSHPKDREFLISVRDTIEACLP